MPLSSPVVKVIQQPMPPQSAARKVIHQRPMSPQSTARKVIHQPMLSESAARKVVPQTVPHQSPTLKAFWNDAVPPGQRIVSFPGIPGFTPRFRAKSGDVTTMRQMVNRNLNPVRLTQESPMSRIYNPASFPLPTRFPGGRFPPRPTNPVRFGSASAVRGLRVSPRGEYIGQQRRLIYQGMGRPVTMKIVKLPPGRPVNLQGPGMARYPVKNLEPPEPRPARYFQASPASSGNEDTDDDDIRVIAELKR